MSIIEWFTFGTCLSIFILFILNVISVMKTKGEH